jgi:hypothetical protein
MSEQTITKQAIKRLNESPISTRLVNHSYKVATVKAEFSRYSLELVVERSHPKLAFSSTENKEYLIYWKGCSGSHIYIPTELDPLILKLEEVAIINDDEADIIRNEWIQAMKEFNLQFYGNYV